MAVSSADFPYPEHAEEITEEMLTMSVEALSSVARYPLTILPDRQTLYARLAHLMADEIRQSNETGDPLRWILPVGPKSQYPLLAEITNRERLSWRNVYSFHMDEYLDWQARPVPADHLFSFRGYCRRNLYDLIDPELRPPADQIIFPAVTDLDGYSEQLDRVGGADLLIAGFGYRGLVAFNEPPSTRWHQVSVAELAASKTRILSLREDTLVALSQRMTGGYTQAIPPMAVTIGMADMLGARKALLVTDGGAWKQYIVRVLLLTTEPDADLPVTLFHNHPNAEVMVDAASIAPLPMGLVP
jgi:glucosamine-6-phosphate deaminase